MYVEKFGSKNSLLSPDDCDRQAFINIQTKRSPFLFKLTILHFVFCPFIAKTSQRFLTNSFAKSNRRRSFRDVKIILRNILFKIRLQNWKTLA